MLLSVAIWSAPARCLAEVRIEVAHGALSPAHIGKELKPMAFLSWGSGARPH